MNPKIIPLNKLEEVCSELRSQGKTIAQCHGAFDLMHPGHIKHFNAAQSLADVLIVTLTPDHYVNKGPGRPVFNESLRLETIAAIGNVNYVVLNDTPTAVEIIQKIKPDFFVKGQDYKDPRNDITGNFREEVKAVEGQGGQVHFTDEVVFSSSKLINAHFNPLEERVQEYLEAIKSKYTSDFILDEIDKFANLKVMILGDTIIDEYHYCSPMGTSSKSHNLSTRFLHAKSFAGGVLAIANHVEQFANKVSLVTTLGKDDSKLDIIEPKLSNAVERNFFYHDEGPTNIKRRYVTEFLNSKLFSVNFLNDDKPKPELEDEIIAHLESCIKDYDIVMVADFGHGMVTKRIRDYVIANGNYVAINAQTNSANYGYNYITKYKDVDYISIDEKELRLPFGEQYASIEGLVANLHDETNCPSIMITLGRKGALFFEGGNVSRAPVLSTAVVDSVGAGDAVLSVSTLCAHNKLPGDLMTFIGNCVGAIAVKILGNERPVNKGELSKFIHNLMK